MNLKQLFTLVLACTFASQAAVAKNFLDNLSPEMIALEIRFGNLGANDTVCLENTYYSLATYEVTDNKTKFKLTEENSPESYIEFSVKYEACPNGHVDYSLPCKVQRYDHKEKKHPTSFTSKLRTACGNIMEVATTAVVTTAFTGGAALVGTMFYKMTLGIANSEYVPGNLLWKPTAGTTNAAVTPAAATGLHLDL